MRRTVDRFGNDQITIEPLEALTYDPGATDRTINPSFAVDEDRVWLSDRMRFIVASQISDEFPEPGGETDVVDDVLDLLGVFACVPFGASRPAEHPGIYKLVCLREIRKDVVKFFQDFAIQSITCCVPLFFF